MAYSDFTLRKVKTDFQLELIEDQDLFAHIPARPVSEFLAAALKQNVPLALAIGTEKARSELIIINVLLELKQALHVSFFSGIDFTVDKEQGLNGYCDFIISQSPEQFFVDAPVVSMVEAKNEQVSAGLGQCIAEMIAARIFNERERTSIAQVYGAVTTGHAWKFLKLQQQTVYIDVEDYYIKNPEKILGILTAMIQQTA